MEGGRERGGEGEEVYCSVLLKWRIWISAGLDPGLKHHHRSLAPYDVTQHVVFITTVNLVAEGWLS